MSTNKVKVGIVGTGGIAQLVHIPALKRIKEAELVAICDLHEDVVKEVARKYGVKKWYTDYMEMFEREKLDAILNLTWHSAHAKVTIDAADSGLHVFVEKPMAVTIEECEEMIKACEKNNVKLMVGFMKRFDPNIRWIKEELDKGSLGRVFMINSWYYDTVIHMEYVKGFIDEFIRPRKLQSRGYEVSEDKHLYALLTHGIHHADLLLWIGGNIDSLYSYYKDYEESYVSTTILEFENGAVGYFQLAGGIVDDWDEGLIVKGTAGSARAKIRFPYFKWRSEVEVYFKSINGYVRKLVPYRDMYLSELEHFIRCIIEDRLPEPNGYDGLRANKLIYAIHESAKLGKSVKL